MDPELLAYIQSLLQGGQMGVPQQFGGADQLMGTLLPPESQFEGEPFTLEDQNKALTAQGKVNNMYMDPIFRAMSSLTGGSAMLNPSMFAPTDTYAPLDPELQAALSDVERYAGMGDDTSLWGGIAQGILADRPIEEMLTGIQAAYQNPDDPRHQIALDDMPTTWNSYDQTWEPDIGALRERAYDLDSKYRMAVGQVTDAEGNRTIDPSTGKAAVYSQTPSDVAQRFTEAGYYLPTETYNPDMLATADQLQQEAEWIMQNEVLAPQYGATMDRLDEANDLRAKIGSDAAAVGEYERYLDPAMERALIAYETTRDEFESNPGSTIYQDAADTASMAAGMYLPGGVPVPAPNMPNFSDMGDIARRGVPAVGGLAGDLMGSVFGGGPLDDLPDSWRQRIEQTQGDAATPQGVRAAQGPQMSPELRAYMDDRPDVPTGDVPLPMSTLDGREGTGVMAGALDPDKTRREWERAMNNYLGDSQRQLIANRNAQQAFQSQGQRQAGVEQLAQMGYSPFAEQITGTSILGNMLGISTGGPQRMTAGSMGQPASGTGQTGNQFVLPEGWTRLKRPAGV